MFLSLLPGNQVVRVVEYGTSIFLSEPYPPRSIFPSDMAEFGDGTALTYRAREANLPEPAREAMTAYGAAAM